MYKTSQLPSCITITYSCRALHLSEIHLQGFVLFIAVFGVRNLLVGSFSCFVVGESPIVSSQWYFDSSNVGEQIQQSGMII